MERELNERERQQVLQHLLDIGRLSLKLHYFGDSPDEKEKVQLQINDVITKLDAIQKLCKHPEHQMLSISPPQDLFQCKDCGCVKKIVKSV